MNTFWDYVVLGNSVRDWLIALGIIVISFILIRVLKHLVIKRFRIYTTTTKSTFDDFIISLLQSSAVPVLYIIAVYTGLKYLFFPEKFRSVENAAVMVIITFFVVKSINSLISYFFKQALLKHEKNDQREKQSRGILLIIKIILWAIGLLFLIDNLGYDITTIIAGLGIGGIAIALAAQTILADLFSYLVIFFDKPFEVGDFIIVDDKLGTIEYVGIKTTHIRTLSGEQLICSNTDLTNSRVHNYKRMDERRIVFSFKVTYHTTAEQLKQIVGIVKNIITDIKGTRFDRAHFKEFGDFSLNYEVVYFVLSPDFNLYMDIQQAINLKLVEEFEKEKILFAIPSQNLFFQNQLAASIGEVE